MLQSLSGGSGAPLRMTLTVIFSFRESSNMRQNYSMHKLLGRRCKERAWILFYSIDQLPSNRKLPELRQLVRRVEAGEKIIDCLDRE